MSAAGGNGPGRDGAAGRESGVLPLFRAALLAAVVGIAGVVFVAVAHPAFALQAWLAAAFMVSAVPLGALGLLLMGALAGGPWHRPLAPVLRACAATLPLFAIVFLPVIAFPSLIYPWAAPGAGDDPSIAAKAAWLDPAFFAIRTIVYFAVWIGLAFLMAARADREERQARKDGSASREGGGLLLPGVGVVLYALTTGFAAIDWAMSVDPKFPSSAFGMLVTLCDLLAALAFAVPVVAWLGRVELREAASGQKVRNALAGLLASGVLLWAYVSFMQYLTVWSGDLPGEASWYLDRAAGGWVVVPWALGLLLGVVPLVGLALPAGRASLKRLAAIAALIFVMRAIQAVWLILPSFAYRSWLQPTASASATLALAGSGLAAVLWLWARSDRRALSAEGVRHG